MISAARFRELYADGLAATGTPDHPDRPARFFNLVNLFGLRHSGPTVEVGCWRGLSSFLLLSARDEDGGPRGHHWVMDSFLGLQPTPEDELPDGARGRFGGVAAADVALALSAFGMTGVSEIDALDDGFHDLIAEGAPYAFVHVDVDLYAPTLACLRLFWPLLAPGGLIVVDDYGPWDYPTNHYPGCAKALAEFSAESGEPFAVLTPGNAVFVKGSEP